MSASAVWLFNQVVRIGWLKTGKFVFPLPSFTFKRKIWLQIYNKLLYDTS